MDKIKKISISIILALILLSMVSAVLASNEDVIKGFSGNITGAGKTAQKSAVTILSSVLDIIRTVGAAVAVVILIVLACKYIIASAGDRADIKKYAVTYIIGALILFGASGITSIVKSFVDASINS